MSNASKYQIVIHTAIASIESPLLDSFGDALFYLKEHFPYVYQADASYFDEWDGTAATILYEERPARIEMRRLPEAIEKEATIYLD